VEIRPFTEAEREVVCEIALRTFEAVSIDAAIERGFGELNGTTWRDRKRRDINSDLDANPGGCFVAVLDGQVVGFVTTVLDRAAAVGRIANLAADTGHQGQGIGKALVSHALDYFQAEGMTGSQIETTTTNERGMRFYPAVGYCEVARKIYYFMPLADRRDR
jgi:ribosomal protein S18 acetylase RimI-like enzyme